MQQNNIITEKAFIDRLMPKEVSHLISQSKYDTIIDITLACFRDKADKIISIKKGVVVIADENGHHKASYSFFNLIRRLCLTNVSRWQAEIFSFFNDKVNVAAHNFFFKDYEHASKYLKILVKPADFLSASMREKMITMQHFPGTLSYLVLHYEEKFCFLQYDFVREWNVSKEDLFAQALHNLKSEKVYRKVFEAPDGQEYNIIMSAHYSAARMINPEWNTPFLIGELGALFTLPANGAVFAIPYRKEKDIIVAFRLLMRLTLEAFKIEPSPIIIDLFHYHKGHVSSMMDYVRQHCPEAVSLLKNPRNM